MPSFEIADGPAEIPLSPAGGGWSGSTVFSVTNHAPAKVNARFGARPAAGAAADWLAVSGGPLRTMDVGETIAVTVDIRVPAAAPPGRAGLTLRVVNENDSNNDWTDGAERAFTVPAKEEAPPAPPPSRRGLPWWAFAILALLAAGAFAIWWSNRPEPPEPPVRPKIPKITLVEDCLAFGSDPLQVSFLSGRWKIVSGSHWIFDFGSSLPQAQQAFAIITRYGASQSCFVGRPDPSFTYLRTPAGTIPEGAAPGEDCIPISPLEAKAAPLGSKWVVNGGGYLTGAPNEAEARQIVRLLRKYKPTHQCFVGRPMPNLVYFRR